MKKMSKTLALVLALSLILGLMAACAPSEQPITNNTDSTMNNQNPANEATDKSSEDSKDNEQSQDGPQEIEDPTEIVFYYFSMNQNDPSGIDRVAEEVNKITQEKLNITVDLNTCQLSEYRTALPLMIAGGETLDLFNLLNGPVSFPTLMANGSLMDISEYLPVYAPDAYELVKDTIGAYTVDGGIYAVTNYRNFNSNQYALARKDTLEELGLIDQFYAMTSWSDWEAICEIVAEKTDLYPMGGSKVILWNAGTSCIWGSDSFEFTPYDTLSDATNLLRVENSDPTVKYIYEQEDTIWTLKMVKEWYEKGWVYPETYISSENAQVLLKNGVTFANFTKSEIGAAENWSSRAGVDMLATLISDEPILVTTGQIQMGSMVVPITAQEPEAAVRFINELYTNPDLLNLLAWGVEGEHYEINADGEAAYPNGNSTVAYHNMDYTMGNFFLYLPWDGNGADYRVKCLEENEKAVNSDYLGFNLDAEEFDVLVSQLVNIYEEYGPTLNSGLYSDEALAEMNAKMEQSGLREYVDGVQKQLDAWLAAR